MRLFRLPLEHYTTADGLLPTTTCRGCYRTIRGTWGGQWDGLCRLSPPANDRKNINYRVFTGFPSGIKTNVYRKIVFEFAHQFKVRFTYTEETMHPRRTFLLA